jgi:hypothetical protein
MDISHPQQVVQASHACIESAKAFPLEKENIPNLVVFGVADENSLRQCAEDLDKNSIQYYIFIEPDCNNEATAIATEPVTGKTRRFFRNYQLLKGENSGSN